MLVTVTLELILNKLVFSGREVLVSMFLVAKLLVGI